jgi:hypothetical protein
MQMRKDTGEIENKVVFSKTGKRVVHGTKTAYQYHGCRCFACHEEQKRYVREATRRQRGFKAKVYPEEYMPYLQKHLDRGVLAYRIAQFSGLDSTVLSAILRRRRPILQSTFEILKGLPDDLPVGRANSTNKQEIEARKPPPPEAKQRYALEAKRKNRFSRIIRWLYDNGFTEETLCDRLGLTVKEWNLFCIDAYRDKRIGMRLCQLHHLLRQGE